jgi:hypothetical protein
MNSYKGTARVCGPSKQLFQRLTALGDPERDVFCFRPFALLKDDLIQAF